MGEGGLSIPYPVDFWPDFPICHKFSSKINNFPTRYRGKFVLNILYKSHWLIFLTNSRVALVLETGNDYLSDRWSLFCLLMDYRAVFDFRFFPCQRDRKMAWSRLCRLWLLCSWIAMLWFQETACIKANRMLVEPIELYCTILLQVQGNQQRKLLLQTKAWNVDINCAGWWKGVYLFMFRSLANSTTMGGSDVQT